MNRPENEELERYAATLDYRAKELDIETEVKFARYSLFLEEKIAKLEKSLEQSVNYEKKRYRTIDN